MAAFAALLLAVRAGGQPSRVRAMTITCRTACSNCISTACRSARVHSDKWPGRNRHRSSAGRSTTRSFDRLHRDLPGWIAVAFADYDTAIIRAAHAGELSGSRAEPDGFSLRLTPRGTGTASTAAAAAAAASRRPITATPQNARFTPPALWRRSGLRGAYGPDDYGAARAYYAAERAVRPRR